MTRETLLKRTAVEYVDLELVGIVSFTRCHPLRGLGALLGVLARRVRGITRGHTTAALRGLFFPDPFACAVLSAYLLLSLQTLTAATASDPEISIMTPPT